MIRPATVEDIPRILEMADSAYPEQEWDAESVARWGEVALQSPNVLCLVGDRAFGLSTVTSPFYNPKLVRGYMVFLAGVEGCGWEPCKILRAMVSWALQEKGAASYHLGEQTGIDLSPLAKRVGAALDSASYVVKRKQ